MWAMSSQDSVLFLVVYSVLPVSGLKILVSCMERLYVGELMKDTIGLSRNRARVQIFLCH